MTILTRYLLKEVSWATLAITLIFTGAVWLTQSLRFVDFFITRGVSLTAFFKLLLFLLPDLVGIILPLGFLVGVLFIYNRLYVDHELIVLRCTGMSSLDLIKPTLIVASGVVLILYAINLYFLPIAFNKFKDLEFQLRNTLSESMIQPGEFNPFKESMVYVRNREKNGRLKGIFIYDASAQDTTKHFTMVAEEGFLQKNSNGLKILLIQGHRQDVNPVSRKPRILSFDQYTLDLIGNQPDLKDRPKKPYEKFLHELLDDQSYKDNPLLERRYKVEAHQRLAFPLTSIAFVLIAMAIFLRGEENRRGRSRRMITIVLLSCALEILIVSLVNLGEKWPFLFGLIYGLLALISLISFFFLVRDQKMGPTSEDRLF